METANAPADHDVKTLLRKFVYLHYAVGFSIIAILITEIDVFAIQKFFPESYTHWKFVWRPLVLFGASLAITDWLSTKYQAQGWGQKVARRYKLISLVAAVLSFLPVYFPQYFPNTYDAIPAAVKRFDLTMGKWLNPPPPPPPPPQQPRQILVENPYQQAWFGPTGQPLVWYARDPSGTFRYYDRQGPDPSTGVNLRPITRQIVEQAEHQYDVAQQDAKHQQELLARQAMADAARTAVNSGNFEQALLDCPSMDPKFSPDPCADAYREAAHLKADDLIGRGEKEIQQKKFYAAIRQGQEALRYDPDNPEAKAILHLAQAEQQLAEAPNP